MAIVDPRAGSCYVWVVTAILFGFVTVGGVFLGLYIFRPENPSSDRRSSSRDWFLNVGVTLVCLPWLFWILACLYRVISRACGFRMACWGVSPYPDVVNPIITKHAQASKGAPPSVARNDQSSSIRSAASHDSQAPHRLLSSSSMDSS